MLFSSGSSAHFSFLQIHMATYVLQDRRFLKAFRKKLLREIFLKKGK
jgi:hypothetical protein